VESIIQNSFNLALHCSCEFQLHYAISLLTNSGFIARFRFLKIPASLRAFASCEYRLGTFAVPLGNSGFATRFRLLRILASLRASAS
jgi:hypothetical protein